MTSRRVPDRAALITASLLAVVLTLAGCAQAPQPAAQTAAAGPGPVRSAGYTSGSPLVPRSNAAPSSRALSSSPTGKATSAAMSAAVRTTAKPAPGGLAALPVAGYVGGARQAITVVGPAGATTASLQAWNRTATGWVRYGPVLPAWLGSAGLTSNAREGFSGTPIGSFTLTHAFGNDSDPGTALPYFQAGPDDWWSGDVNSPTYNTHQRCAAADCSFRTAVSENLHDAGSVYGYALVIDYNSAPVVAGKGSAFFLHVSQNQPTEGCVSIAQDALVRILRWLDPAQQPRILMGIG